MCGVIGKMKKAIYLKINRTEEFAIRNLSRWIYVSMKLKRDCYILCDKNEIVENISKRLCKDQNVSFIKSIKNSELEEIIKYVTNHKWANAGYAHLTTFIHANIYKYDSFWNIDADDTQFCVSENRLVELLTTIEQYAENEEIDVFSLDMWRSETLGEHWSFGITYTNGKIDWIKQFYIHYKDEEYLTRLPERRCNVDWFFTYLRSVAQLRIETFYVENLKFIHYTDDFFNKPISAGFYHWKNGKLIYPLLYYCFDIKEQAIFDIFQDVIKIDIGIQDDEARSMLSYYATEERDLSDYYNLDYVDNVDISKVKMKHYLRLQFMDLIDVEKIQIVCWGTGDCFKRNIKKLKKICNLTMVCDNDESKWGKVVEGNIRCVSREEIVNLKEIFVFILIDDIVIVNQIKKQLNEMGIEKCAHIEEWLQFEKKLI